MEVTAKRGVTIYSKFKHGGAAEPCCFADGDSLVYIHGHDNLAAGAENALEGKPKGALLGRSVTDEPATTVNLEHGHIHGGGYHHH